MASARWPCRAVPGAVWWLLGLMAWPAAATAQTDWPMPRGALPLTMSTLLTEQLAPGSITQVPSFLSGNSIQGQIDVNTVVEGQAELRRHDTVVRAERLEHLQATDTVQATGNVRIVRMGNTYEGPRLTLKLDTFEGSFDKPQFTVLATGGQGQADRLDFLGKDKTVAHNASYSTCPRPGLSRSRPDWEVRASRIEFDQAEDTGTATGGVLYFKGVPLLAAPYVSFPLSDQRKSGLLPPTINLDSQSGLELTLPYYLNLAPNYDATLYPTLMTKRGVDLGGELRYLERTFDGRLRAAYMSNDRLRDTNRWGGSLQHQQLLADNLAGGRLGLSLNLNRVSDDNYWRDFPRSSTSLTQRLLANNASLSWGQGPWSATLGSYRWQTLQDATNPIVAPYDRVPSFGFGYRPDPFALGSSEGWQWSVRGQLTRFETDRIATIWDGSSANQATDVNGSRALTIARLQKTWQAPGWYIKPSAQLHLRQYQFDQALGNGLRTMSYAIPTLSLDAGLVFERNAHLFGRDYVHTLEPRIFYTRTPYRDQRFLPVYDSAAFDFNAASIFAANPYAGDDRIADMHALTVGATTRLIQPETGDEIVSLDFAQRFRFRDQQVSLPNETLSTVSQSDMLFGARVHWDPAWTFNGTVQFSPETNRSVRTTLGARYQPGSYRVFNAYYRLKRGTSEQLDLSWQWPLSDLFTNRSSDQGPLRGLGAHQWYSVGRFNYSVPDRRFVDMVAGLEYDAGCWIGRIVLERLQQSSSESNQRILFQLEFVGFSRIGSNPLQTLRDNIPRYQYLREDTLTPSRFESYE
jgi:LPS-assembly protein